MGMAHNQTGTLEDRVRRLEDDMAALRRDVAELLLLLRREAA